MTSTRPVVIDDTDARVAYDGQGWFQDNGSQDPYGNYGPTYMHTLHGTNANNSLSFSFNGTSVKILGTNNPTKIGDNFDPSWDCYVDKLKIGTTKPSTDRQNNFVLCESGQLTNGEHQITLNVTTRGQTFWFDTIQYVPRVGDSYDSAVTVVDNTDSQIEWSTGWALIGGAQANLTLVRGSNVRFNFTGTSLTWMSWISWGPPHPATTSSYSVDGGDPVTFNLPGLPENATYDLFNQPSFTTPQLLPGPHSVLVTYLGDGEHTPLILDYLLVTNTTLAKNTTSTGEPQATGTSPLGKKSMVGPIVGGVVGGVAFLAIIALIIFLLVRRRKPKQTNRMSIISNGTPGVAPFMSSAPGDQQGLVVKPTPYTTVPTAASSNHLFNPQPQESQARLPSPYYSETGSDFGAGLYGQHSPSGVSSTQRSNGQSSRLHATNPSISTSEQSATSNWAGVGSGPLVPVRKAQEVRENAQPEPALIHHHDSGVRMQPPRPVDDVPPMYTEG